MSADQKSRLVLILFIISIHLPVYSCGLPADSVKEESQGIRSGRLAGVLIAEGALHLGSLTGLYYAWYRDYPQSNFHFFNDNGEWMQVDKCGHAITSYYITRVGYAGYRWSGVGENASAWYGGLLGFAYMLNIEVLDGFSSEWGFSAGDFTANTLGSLIFIGQQLTWHEQRFTLKYSFHQTKYAKYRPDLMGDNLIQNMIKDYNGHSYWISGNISSFLPEETKFPRWLNIAVGYGAEGMTGAFGNSQSSPGYTRYRKFFLSLDVDLTRIPTRSKVLRGVFSVISFIKIPAPALEFNTFGKIRFYPVYY